MAQIFGNGIKPVDAFHLGSPNPVDAKFLVEDYSGLQGHVDGGRAYEGMIVFVENDDADGHKKGTYQYIDGNWEEFGFNDAKFEAKVVDNLTTEDDKKALSAKQGKVLAEMIGEINHSENGILAQAKEYTDEVVGDCPTEIAMPDGVDEEGAPKEKTIAVENVIDYIDKVAEKTLAQAQGGSNETAASVKLQLDNYKAENVDRFNKLDGIQAGAQVNAVEVVKVNGEALTITDKAVNIAVPTGTLAGKNEVAEDDLESTLATKINSKAAQADLEAVSGVANAAATQVALGEEINRATQAEGALSDRLDEVEAFFELAEGEKLDTALDTLKEIQEYITGEGAAADQMVIDIAKNKEDIAALAKKHDDEMDAAEGRLDTLEGHFTGENSVDKKIEAAKSGAEATAKAYTDAEVKKITDSYSTTEAMNAAIAAAIEPKADKTTVEGIDARVTANTNAVATKAESSRVEEVDERVGSLEEYVDIVADAVNDHYAELNGIVDKVAENEKNIANIDIAIKDLEDYNTTVADALNELEDNKADRGTTLADYGIANAYTKTEVDGLVEGAKITAVSYTDGLIGILPVDPDSVTEENPDGTPITVVAYIESKADEADLEGLEGRLKELAYKSNVAEANLDSALATKINGKANATDVYSIAAADEKFVVKVDGKGLSTNDLTNELVAKINAAQANVIESVKVNGAALTITNKAVDVTVPTKVSELTNDAQYLVAKDIEGKANIADVYTKETADEKTAEAIAALKAEYRLMTTDEIDDLFPELKPEEEL